MIDPYDYYSWGSFQESELKKLSVEDLQILADFQDSSYLSSGSARQSFPVRLSLVRRTLNSKLKVLESKRSTTPERELENLLKKIEMEEKELSLIRQKKSKIERIESDLERKIQRQIERIQYLRNH